MKKAALRSALVAMLLSGILLALGVPPARAQGPAAAAGLVAERPSFMAGSPAIFRGQGFAPHELVTFQVTHVSGTPVVGNHHTPTPIVADANGGFVAHWITCAIDCAGEMLRIEGTGQTSGRVGRATFMNTPVRAGARVTTDKADYAPGTTAHFSGGGFRAGETVTVQVHHADGTPDTGEDHQPWTVVAGTDGAWSTTWHVCEDDCLNSTLRLTALGMASGITAQAFFTDAIASSTFERIHSFGTPGTGANPYSRLIQGTDGALYGTAVSGGQYGGGTVFKLNTDGSDAVVLHSFTYSGGAFPTAGLVQGVDGALYGTASSGGSFGYGVVFKLNADGSGFTVLQNFDYGTSGAYAYGGLMQATDGALYGMTHVGGSNFTGTIYKLNTDGTGFTVLQNFDYTTTGGYPYVAMLTQGTDGSLYGTATGGSSGYGTIFKLNMDGSGFTVLRNLVNSDGGTPYGRLLQGTDGALYGAGLQGGLSGAGALFKLNTDGTGFTVLHEFAWSDGAYPYDGPIQGTDGALYGPTYMGGSLGAGTVYRMNTDGSGFSTLEEFDYTSGSNPQGGLVQGTDGALYGTTQQGGATGTGMVYRLNTDGSGFALLLNLTYGTDVTGGAYPQAGLTQGTDGALYGTTYGGGNAYTGAVFKLNGDGSGYTKLHDFTWTTGAYVYSSLTQGTDGALYGTTVNGGSFGWGVVFRLNTDGSGYTVLHNFDYYTSAAYPFSGVVQGSDGALYGTAYQGGTLFYGMVYRLNTDGSGFTVLKQFDYSASGGYPFAALIQGSDGALYGGCLAGGIYGQGTLFKLNVDGSGFTVLKNLDYSTSGASPYARLLQGTDGALYGTAYSGGSFGAGTVFKLNTDGSGFTVLRSLDYTSDGAYPYNAGLAQGPDGAIYGAAYYGGNGDAGTLFALNTDGSDFTVLHSFDNGVNGGYPTGDLMRAADGNIYGTSPSGGDASAGTIFRLVFESNQPPIARCKDVTVPAGTGCVAAASIDDGSSDPDAGDTITLAQSPPGPYALGMTSVTLTVTDSQGATSSCAATVTVTNATPVATIAGPASGAVFAVNNAVPFTGTWTDANGGPHTAQWTFDGVPDASFSAGSGNSGSANTSHTFTAAGVYLVQLAVTDECSASGTATQVGGVDAMVVVFDPDAGFVTGGGWIHSPAGAFVADPSLTGKANFGFVSKYKKGAAIPTGETEFQYKVGNLNFHSTSYQWLVVAGARAQYKGNGTINGAGNFGFILTAIDGAIAGDGVDKFRMKITQSGGGLVYDNLLDAPDGDDPTTVVGGGSIVIHTGGKSASVEAGESRDEDRMVAASIPAEFALSQNHPNPFEQTTRIGFGLPEHSRVRIAVYDLAGREVRTLADGEWAPGWHSATLARTDERGTLGAGVYFVRMSARSLASGRGFTAQRKVVLAR